MSVINPLLFVVLLKTDFEFLQLLGQLVVLRGRQLKLLRELLFLRVFNIFLTLEGRIACMTRSRQRFPAGLGSIQRAKRSIAMDRCHNRTLWGYEISLLLAAHEIEHCSQQNISDQIAFLASSAKKQRKSKKKICLLVS